jgi:hypothetical protein
MTALHSEKFNTQRKLKFGSGKEHNPVGCAQGKQEWLCHKADVEILRTWGAAMLRPYEFMRWLVQGGDFLV